MYDSFISLDRFPKSDLALLRLWGLLSFPVRSLMAHYPRRAFRWSAWKSNSLLIFSNDPALVLLPSFPTNRIRIPALSISCRQFYPGFMTWNPSLINWIPGWLKLKPAERLSTANWEACDGNLTPLIPVSSRRMGPHSVFYGCSIPKFDTQAESRWSSGWRRYAFFSFTTSIGEIFGGNAVELLRRFRQLLCASSVHIFDSNWGEKSVLELSNLGTLH